MLQNVTVTFTDIGKPGFFGSLHHELVHPQTQEDAKVADIQLMQIRTICPVSFHNHGCVLCLLIICSGTGDFFYRVEAEGQDGGFGFVTNDVFRFWFNNHIGSITEIGFQARAPGALLTYGFTNRNSAGNYIMWHEKLERIE